MNLNERKYLWHLKCKFHTGEYYFESYETYWGNSWRITSKGHDFINHHFYELTQVYKIEITKEWLTSYMKETPNRYQDPNRKEKVYFWRWKAKIAARNDSTHYVRQSHHKKKVLTDHEIAKRDWCLKNKVRKDNADKHYGREPKQFVKRLSNRKHRNWQNHKIANGDFDFSDRDYKYTVDLWFWD